MFCSFPHVEIQALQEGGGQESHLSCHVMVVVVVAVICAPHCPVYLLFKLGIDSQWVSGWQPASERSHIAWSHVTTQTVGPHVGGTPLVAPHWNES